MQTEFINISPHELRIPVQPLLVMADVLESEYGGNKNEQDRNRKIEISKQEVEIISRNAKRLEKLSSDLLDASRIESQSMILKKEEFDLSGTIKEIVQDF